MRRIISFALCAGFMIPAGGVLAQQPPVESMTPQPLPEGRLKGKVVTDFSEVRAGPGAVYLSRGRVYQGDVVEIRRRSDNGEWVEITGGGVQGWVRARYLEILGANDQRKQPTDAGRNRRQTNFVYDEQGRRIGPDGRPVGSGEGTGFDDMAGGLDGNLDDPSGESPVSFRLGIGAVQMKRVFASDVVALNDEVDNSLLRNVDAQPTGVTLEADAIWNAHKYVVVRADIRAALQGETTIPANPELNIQNPVPIGVRTLQFNADVVGRYGFGPGWAGVYAGPRYYQHAFQETQPLVFPSTEYIGAGVGATGQLRFGPVEISGSAGVFLPLAINQSPAESGNVASSSGVEASGALAWYFKKNFAVVASGHYTKLTVDFSGQSTHGDGFVDPGNVFTYSRARETNSVTGGSLGLRWAL